MPSPKTLALPVLTATLLAGAVTFASPAAADHGPPMTRGPICDGRVDSAACDDDYRPRPDGWLEDWLREPQAPRDRRSPWKRIRFVQRATR